MRKSNSVIMTISSKAKSIKVVTSLLLLVQQSLVTLPQAVVAQVAQADSQVAVSQAVAQVETLMVQHSKVSALKNNNKVASKAEKAKVNKVAIHSGDKAKVVKAKANNKVENNKVAKANKATHSAVVIIHGVVMKAKAVNNKVENNNKLLLQNP